jgi:hypothetical protein
MKVRCFDGVDANIEFNGVTGRGGFPIGWYIATNDDETRIMYMRADGKWYPLTPMYFDNEVQASNFAKHGPGIGIGQQPTAPEDLVHLATYFVVWPGCGGWDIGQCRTDGPHGVWWLGMGDDFPQPTPVFIGERVPYPTTRPPVPKQDTRTRI